MSTENKSFEQILSLAQEVINASDCAVGMLNSLASLFAGIQAMADSNQDVHQLAMLGQEVIDGYMETMRSYKDNMPELAEGVAK